LDDSLDIRQFVREHIQRFAEEVDRRLGKFS
jgi:hypothetical protein